MVTTASPEKSSILITLARQGQPAVDGTVFTRARLCPPHPLPPARGDVGLCQEAELDRTAGVLSELPAFV